jgi:histidinol-phosphate aminotransferase/threonine-phosphate decarboxylase
MRQREFVSATRERVREERVRMRERLSARFEVHPSDAPFLLLAVPDVEVVQREVEAADVAVRDARTFRGLDSHVRVAVRTRAENDRLLEALDV